MKLSRVGVDLAKNVYQLHGIDRRGKTIWKRRLRRGQWLQALLDKTDPDCEIGMEACTGAHQWARSSAACNQVRRACNSVAKAGAKVEFAVCDEGRDTCRAACEIDDTSCVQAALDAGDVVAADAAGCTDCCNATRTTCRDLAKDVRAATRLLCIDSRTTCNETCVSVDGNCVRGCVKTRRGLEVDAKRTANACKRACTRGPDRRPCVRSCRKILNQQFQLFSNQEAVCIGTTCIQP